MSVIERTLKNKITGAIIVLSSLAVSGDFAYAEDVEAVRYVTDQLTLKMYKDSALSQALPSLKSGEHTILVKRDGTYSQVKLGDGTVGWVKNSYLVKDKPAAVLLPDLQKELDDLRSKHTDLLIEQPEVIQSNDTQLQSRLEAAESSQQNMKLRMQELEAERLSSIEDLQNLRQQSVSTEITDNKDEQKLILLWIILPLLTLISGFFIGFKFLEGKIKERFGGYNPL